MRRLQLACIDACNHAEDMLLSGVALSRGSCVLGRLFDGASGALRRLSIVVHALDPPGPPERNGRDRMLQETCVYAIVGRARCLWRARARQRATADC